MKLDFTTELNALGREKPPNDDSISMLDDTIRTKVHKERSKSLMINPFNGVLVSVASMMIAGMFIFSMIYIKQCVPWIWHKTLDTFASSEEKHPRDIQLRIETNNTNCITENYHSQLVTLHRSCLLFLKVPVENEKCFFPFFYGGKLFSKCTNYMAPFHWCGTRFYVTDEYGWGVCNAECFSKNSIPPETSTIDPPRPEEAWVTTNLLREKQYQKTCHDLTTGAIPSDFNFKQLGLPTYPSYYPPALSKFNSGYPYWRKIDATRCRNLCQRANSCSFFTYSYYPCLCGTYHWQKPYPIRAISGRKHDASH